MYDIYSSGLTHAISSLCKINQRHQTLSWFAQPFVVPVQSPTSLMFCHSLPKSGSLPSAFCRALGKVLLSVMTTFTESRTLGIEIHSAKGHQQPSKADNSYFCRVPSPNTRQRSFFAECLTPDTRQRSFFAECLTLDTRQSLICRVPFLDTRQSIIFSFPNQTFFGMFLHYVDLHVPFWHNYKIVFYNY
jgi:hypothetical protein